MLERNLNEQHFIRFELCDAYSLQQELSSQNTPKFGLMLKDFLAKK